MGNSFMEVRMRYLRLIFGFIFLFSCGQDRTRQNEHPSFDSMTIRPDYSSSINLTGEERKRRTNIFLKELKVATLEHLPLVEDFNEAQFKKDREVAERCIILYGIVFVVHGEASGEEMSGYLNEFGLWDKVSPNERKFLENKNPSD